VFKFSVITSFMLYTFEGYCIQYFFSAFAKPRFKKYNKYAAALMWLIIRSALFMLPSDNIFITVKFIISAFILFLFCIVWYKGNLLFKVFLVIQFTALRELSFFTSYSFICIGNFTVDIIGNALNEQIISIRLYDTAVKTAVIFSITAVQAIHSAVLIFVIKKIVKYYS